MTTATDLLTKDAKNRSVRTFFTGLGIDVLVGVVLVLVAFFGTANGWGDLEWAILGFSVLKSVVQAGGAFVLRRFLDPSGFPTPLPPAPVPQPADVDFGPGGPPLGPGEAGVATAGGILGALGLGLIVLSVILLVLLLLNVYAVSPIVLVVLFVLGLVLWWIGGRPGYGRGAV